MQNTQKTEPAIKNNQSYNERITESYVAGIFGMTVPELKSLLKSYSWPELAYRPLTAKEHDAAIIDAEKQLENNLRVSGSNDNTVWEQGWGEILEQIYSKGFHPALLKPQYFARHHWMRLNGQYIEGCDGKFSSDYDQLLRRIVLSHYLKDATKVVELGCGTGTSQLMLAEILPNAEQVASDWTNASQEIIRAIGQYTKKNIKPVRFNMLTLEGWDELTIDHHSSILTVHALEQLGKNWEPLMDKLLKARPCLCVHLEPILELYDGNLLFDDLAIRYHKRRNYLDGWLARLRELAKQGKIEILEERRLHFGNQYHEASTVIVWR